MSLYNFARCNHDEQEYEKLRPGFLELTGADERCRIPIPQRQLERSHGLIQRVMDFD